MPQRTLNLRLKVPCRTALNKTHSLAKQNAAVLNDHKYPMHYNKKLNKNKNKKEKRLHNGYGAAL